MVKIRRLTLLALLLAARNTFPREFIALLASKKPRGQGSMQDGDAGAQGMVQHGGLESQGSAQAGTQNGDLEESAEQTALRERVIDEYVLLPAEYGESFSSIRLDLLPLDSSIMGSVHSHPSPNARPSLGDLKAFKAMGEIHLIIAEPFSFGSARAFDAKGKQLPLEVVE